MKNMQRTCYFEIEMTSEVAWQCILIDPRQSPELPDFRGTLILAGRPVDLDTVFSNSQSI